MSTLLRSSALLLLIGATLTPATVTASGKAGETVVLLHGLARSERAMRPLAAHLRKSGYQVSNFDYASTRKGPEALVDDLAEHLASLPGPPETIHFVGHSLGGLVARAYLSRVERNDGGRLVMLASPNHGSEIVDHLKEWRLFSWILGPTAAQLGTDPQSFPNRLARPKLEFGVIAGTSSWNPLGSRILPGEDDGTVSVASARLEGMSDFLSIDENHTFIMQSERVATQVVSFLESGRFSKARD